MTLQDIGLGLLKFLSSHRGLTYVPNPNPDQGHAVLVSILRSPSIATSCLTSTQEGNSPVKPQRRIPLEPEKPLPGLPISTPSLRYATAVATGEICLELILRNVTSRFACFSR